MHLFWYRTALQQLGFHSEKWSEMEVQLRLKYPAALGSGILD